MNKVLEIVEFLAHRPVTSLTLQNHMDMGSRSLRLLIAEARRCLRGATIISRPDKGFNWYELTTETKVIVKSANTLIRHGVSEIRMGKTIKKAAYNQGQIELVMDDRRFAITVPRAADGLC